MLIVTNPNAASGSVGSHASHRAEGPRETVSVSVDVQDKGLRAAIGDGFDGLERAFARIPAYRGGRLEHQVVEIPFNRTRGDGVDLFTKYLPESTDTAAIRREGVSFFLETNVGHVELQRYGENKFPEGAFGPH